MIFQKMSIPPSNGNKKNTFDYTKVFGSKGSVRDYFFL